MSLYLVSCNNVDSRLLVAQEVHAGVDPTLALVAVQVSHGGPGRFRRAQVLKNEKLNIGRAVSLKTQPYNFARKWEGKLLLLIM